MILSKNNPLRKDRDLLDLTILAVDRYLENKMFIGSVVDAIQGYARQFNTVSEDWTNRLHTHAVNIEVSYVLALQKYSEIDSQTREEIAEELNKIRTMAVEKQLELETLAKEEDRYPIPSIDDRAIDLTSGWLMCPLCEEVWNCHSTDGMVDCPKCFSKMHNPYYKEYVQP